MTTPAQDDDGPTYWLPDDEADELTEWMLEDLDVAPDASDAEIAAAIETLRAAGIEGWWDYWLDPDVDYGVDKRGHVKRLETVQVRDGLL